MTDYEAIIETTSRMHLDRLTHDELAAINNCVYQDFDPRPVMGYEKVKSLFTERDMSGKPLMKQEIKNAVHRAVLDRLT